MPPFDAAPELPCHRAHVSHQSAIEPDKTEKCVDARNTLNDLNATEWIPETVSVWVQRGLGASHPDAQIERQHPAPFSFTDVSRLIRFFTKRGGVVLDPFLGIGSTSKACALEGRKSVGIELSPRYARLAKQRLQTEVPSLVTSVPDQRILQGDARDVLKTVEQNCIDFVVTSPPYWNILHKEDHKAKQARKSKNLDTRYSDNDRDLGNIHDYAGFLQQVTEILGECGRCLRARKYMAVVVSDFREKSRYITFHSDLASALLPFKLELRGIKILYQRHKRVFPYGYPFSYVPNIHHQYILVMQNMKA